MNNFHESSLSCLYIAVRLDPTNARGSHITESTRHIYLYLYRRVPSIRTWLSTERMAPLSMDICRLRLARRAAASFGSSRGLLGLVPTCSQLPIVEIQLNIYLNQSLWITQYLLFWICVTNFVLPDINLSARNVCFFKEAKIHYIFLDCPIVVSIQKFW